MSIIRSNVEYKVKLSDFEGPLDLLLHLIRDQKLDIKTVQLASVTAQYIAFLQGLDTLDLDLASEFIEVGATLMEIKSKQILPKEKEEVQLSEEEIETRLKAQLEEYKLLKDASEKLKCFENVDRFYKPAAQLKTVVKYTVDDLNLEMLISAFQKMMHKIEQKATPILQKQIRMDRFTVADKIQDIRARFGGGYLRIAFTSLFDNDFSKSEVINTFLALLELLKNQEISCVQEERFGEIHIESKNVQKDSRIEGLDDYSEGAQVLREFIEGVNDDSSKYTVVEGIND